MAMMIQISSQKKDKMAEICEEMLHMGGRLMQCIEGLEQESGNDYQEMGMRTSDRGGYRSEYDRPEYNTNPGMRRGGRY